MDIDPAALYKEYFRFNYFFVFNSIQWEYSGHLYIKHSSTYICIILMSRIFIVADIGEFIQNGKTHRQSTLTEGLLFACYIHLHLLAIFNGRRVTK